MDMSLYLAPSLRSGAHVECHVSNRFSLSDMSSTTVFSEWLKREERQRDDMERTNDPFEALPVRVNGKTLQCQVCGYGLFWQRQAQLNTPFATLLGVDWLNRSAACYVCDDCGYIPWFLPK